MRAKLLLAMLLFLPVAGVPQNQASPYTNSVFASQTFTATGQTGATVQLNSLTVPSTVGSSFASGTITLTGTSLTTVTFSVMASADNGATFPTALPITTVAAPGSTPSTPITATTSGLYQISLAGITHIKFVTSGTFNATSVSLTLTASPNALISRNTGSGGGASVPATPLVLKGLNAVNGVGPAQPGVDYVIPSGTVANATTSTSAMTAATAAALASTTNCSGTTPAASGIQPNGTANCIAAITAPAGAAQDVQTNGGSGSLAADTGNFTYLVGSHQLNTINQSMSGNLTQIGVDTLNAQGAGMYLENDTSTAPQGGSESIGLIVQPSNFGPGHNVGNPVSFTGGGVGWRVIVGVDLELRAYSSGIAQAMHLTCTHYGSGDTACIDAGNNEGFSPCMWVDASGEGCVGININGDQFACIATGTITSTIGTGDPNPVFNISPVNCNGAQELINDGIIIDTSDTIVTTALQGSVSTVWETNQFFIGELAVTPSSVVQSTGMCVITAAIPASTLLDIYQTQNFTCTEHDGLPLTVGHVFLANDGTPEQGDILTVSAPSGGTQTGTISTAKYHPVGSYIFQGGTQGFGDFQDDITQVGLHSVVYVLGAPDTSHLLIAHREGGQFRGQNLPMIGAEPAALTLRGNIIVHPGALCLITNMGNSQCTLEHNTIAWHAGDGFSSPTGLITNENGLVYTSTQSAPDDMNTGCCNAGVAVAYASNSNHSDIHPFFIGGNFASLSKYAGSGVGSGWLFAPPGIVLEGATGNIMQFDNVFPTAGGQPCNGATILCYVNPTGSNANLWLYVDAQGSDFIEIQKSTNTFLFPSGWAINAGGGAFGGVTVGAAGLVVQSINPNTSANDGNVLFNAVNPQGSAFLNMSICSSSGCNNPLNSTNGWLSLGNLNAGGTLTAGAGIPLIDNIFVFTAGTATVCYVAVVNTINGSTAASPQMCLENSATLPDNFIQAQQTPGGISLSYYRVSGGPSQGLLTSCTALSVASPSCVDNNSATTGPATPPVLGTSGFGYVDGLFEANRLQINGTSLFSGVTTFAANILGSGSTWSISSAGAAFFNSLKLNSTAFASTTASDHSIPVIDATGTTYFLRLSTTP
jgi:hypothetical protein